MCLYFREIPETKLATMASMPWNIRIIGLLFFCLFFVCLCCVVSVAMVLYCVL